ncbi:MAG: AAA family ATPase [Halanaerobiales bacterium]
MQELIKNIKENINQVIVGKGEVIELLITALLAEGHVLIDDVPGMGKTKMANSLARSMNVDFKRIQFTPDLQPADITGIYYYNQKIGDFKFRPGPIHSNIILADEINRAVPRTQSSLLEAMEERQVTVEGEELKLEEPFIVVATQNPVELEGTFPLPEAQLDRFLLKIDVGYPTQSEEVEIMKRFKSADPLVNLQAVVNTEDILSMRQRVKEVKISDDLLIYISSLCNKTRNDENIKLGVSPRGALALMKASQAYALIRGRDFVLPDDIKYLFPYVISHRLILAYDSEYSGVKKEEIIENILKEVTVPVEGVISE